jgi:hypothetical protein
MADSSGASAQPNLGSVSSSPWDEKLEDDQAKPQVTGTLSGNGGENAGQKTAAFSVPQNIEDNTPLTIKKVEDFENIKDVDQTLPTGQKTSPEFDYGKDSYDKVAQPEGIKNLIADKPVTVNQPAKPIEPLADSISATKVVASDIVNVQNVPTESTPDDDLIDIFDDSPVSAASVKNIGGDIRPVNSTPDKQPITQAIASNVQPVTAYIQPVALDQQMENTSSAATGDQIIPQKEDVPANGGLLALLKKNRPESDIATQPAIMPSQTAVANQPIANVVNQPKIESQIQQNSIQHQGFKITNRLLIPIITFSIVLIVSGLIYLTEMGAISLGFENVYNTAGIQKFWGGLSKDSADGVPRGFFELGKKDKFKVTGTLSMTIDKSYDSQITTPLISYRSQNLADRPIKANMAVYEDTGSDSSLLEGEYYIDTETGSSVSSSDLSSYSVSDNSDDSSLSSSSYDSASSTSQIDTTTQDMTQSYEEVANQTADVTSNISAFISKQGSQADIELERSTGTENISLKNEQEKFWIRSDNILFSDNAEQGKWLEYNLSSLSGSDLVSQLFGDNVDTNGFSVVGQRIGNEKVGDIRCYNYQIDSLEIGNILMGVGIDSDMIQSVKGNTWIGIKDKMLHKLQVKITIAPSYAVKTLNLDLDFGSFGEDNSFSQPNANQTVEGTNLTLSPGDSSSFSSSSTSSESNASISISSSSSSVAVVDTKAQNDQQRKVDLLSIAEALEKYKATKGSYPKTTAMVKLNSPTNILSNDLISTYLAAMPADPKGSSGWFYGYKCLDGKSYYISSLLEDTSDAEGELLDGLYLYFLRSE